MNSKNTCNDTVYLVSMYIFFADINECDRRFGPSGQCGEGATCTNTLGSFTCTCPSGFSGNGRVKCQGNKLKQ